MPEPTSWWNLAGGWFLKSGFIIVLLLVIFGGTIFGEVKRSPDKTFTRAEQELELTKFGNPELALAEIDKRLASRIERTGFTLTIQDPMLQTIFVVPIRTQWLVSCDKIFGLKVQIGSTSPDDNLDAIIVEIIPRKNASLLSVEQCKQFAGIAGAIMSQMTFVPGR